MQSHYFGVTRGYVQKFCSTCPLCRSHRRRPSSFYCDKADAFDTALGNVHDNSSENTHVQSPDNFLTGATDNFLTNVTDNILTTPASESFTLETTASSDVIDVDELCEADEMDRAANNRGCPADGGPLSSGSRQVHTESQHEEGTRMRNTRTRAVEGIDNARKRSTGVVENARTRAIGDVENTWTETTEDVDNAKTRTMIAVDNTKTRTIVDGEHVYIVTVNEDINLDETSASGLPYGHDSGRKPAREGQEAAAAVETDSERRNGRPAGRRLNRTRERSQHGRLVHSDLQTPDAVRLTDNSVVVKSEPDGTDKSYVEQATGRSMHEVTDLNNGGDTRHFAALDSILIKREIHDDGALAPPCAQSSSSNPRDADTPIGSDGYSLPQHVQAECWEEVAKEGEGGSVGRSRKRTYEPVSYTHLTLPTTAEV